MNKEHTLIQKKLTIEADNIIGYMYIFEEKLNAYININYKENNNSFNFCTNQCEEFKIKNLCVVKSYNKKFILDIHSFMDNGVVVHSASISTYIDDYHIKTEKITTTYFNTPFIKYIKLLNDNNINTDLLDE